MSSSFTAETAQVSGSKEKSPRKQSESFLSGEFLAAYLAMTDSLASDSVKDIPDKARIMSVEIERYLEAHNEEGPADDLVKEGNLINLHADLLQGGKMDMDAARKIYGVISDRVTRAFATGYDAPDRDSYHIFYCSMSGHYWLQKSPDTRNPYFGSRMIGCGSEVEEVQLAAPAKDSDNKEEDNPFAVIDVPPSPRAEAILKELKCTCCGKPLFPATCGCAAGLGKKIKGQIAEMENENLTNEEIITKLRTLYGEKVVPENLDMEK